MKKYLVGAFLSAALLFSNTANTMPIPQYDQMSVHDRASYMSLLVLGAKNALIVHAQADQAQKLVDLFTQSPTGSTQFVQNLQVVRDMNAKNATGPSKKQTPYEVEHAFYSTLKNNGITVPISVLLAINKDFKPSDTNSNGPTKTDPLPNLRTNPQAVK